MENVEEKQPQILPIKIGLISDPPSLTVVYYLYSNAVECGKRKLRKRKMPLRDFSDKSDVGKVLFALKLRHQEFLLPIPSATIERMLRIIQEIQKGLTSDEAVLKVNKEFDVDPEEDLNKVTEKELARKKELMDLTFQKNCVKPNDPDFVYDKEVNFSELKSDNEWDEDTKEDKDEKASDESNPEKEEFNLRSLSYEVNQTTYDTEEQYIAKIPNKLESRNKSLFEKANPIKIDEFDDIGVADIEIEAVPVDSDDEFW